MGTMQPAETQACGSSGAESHIQLYVWDARTEAWNGPTGLSICLRASRRLLQALQATPGLSWYGPVNCGAPGETPTRFFSLIHALGDCAVALIYCNDSRSGPVEIVARPGKKVRHGEVAAERRRPEGAQKPLVFHHFAMSISPSRAMMTRQRKRCSRSTLIRRTLHYFTFRGIPVALVKQNRRSRSLSTNPCQMAYWLRPAPALALV